MTFLQALGEEGKKVLQRGGLAAVRSVVSDAKDLAAQLQLMGELAIDRIDAKVRESIYGSEEVIQGQDSGENTGEPPR